MKVILKSLSIALLLLSVTVTSFAAAESGAEALYRNGFITGSNGDLMLSKSLTRAEVAVIMAELRGKKSEASQYKGQSAFKDVPSSEWYAPYVSYGKVNGFLGGYPDGTFKPNAAVSAQEFAAFMMNALGYTGDYSYSTVLDYALMKNVPVLTRGYVFNRGDAFEAMWLTVNQPMKGATQSLGVSTGRLAASTQPVPQTPVVTKLDYKVDVTSPRQMVVTFTNAVSNINNIGISVQRMGTNVTVNPVWNAQGTTLTLNSIGTYITGTYEVTLTETVNGEKKTYDKKEVKVEAERVTKVLFQSDSITRFDDYYGTVKFTAYNQYGEDVTNGDAAKRLQFFSSTEVMTPAVDFINGMITVQQGSPTLNKLKLSALPSVTIIIKDFQSGFEVSKSFKLDTLSNGLKEVRINGIIDEKGNYAELVYNLNKTYYLDVFGIDTAGNVVRSLGVLGSRTNGQENILVYSASSQYMTVVKTEHPTRSGEIAFKINFVSPPPTDTLVAFTAFAPFATGSTSTNYMIMLKVK